MGVHRENYTQLYPLNIEEEVKSNYLFCSTISLKGCPVQSCGEGGWKMKHQHSLPLGKEDLLSWETELEQQTTVILWGRARREKLEESETDEETVSAPLLVIRFLPLLLSLSNKWATVICRASGQWCFFKGWWYDCCFWKAQTDRLGPLLTSYRHRNPSSLKVVHLLNTHIFGHLKQR